MPDRVEGRVCIVTGAAQGIGAVYAKALAAEATKAAKAAKKERGPLLDRAHPAHMPCSPGRFCVLPQDGHSHTG